MDVFKQVQVEEVKKWLEVIFDIQIGEEDNSLFDALKNGVLLCKLATKLDVTKNFKYNKNPKVSVACHENIQLFLSTCKAWGVKTIFTSIDLYENKNFPQVVSCLVEIGTMFSKQGFQPPLMTTPLHLFKKTNENNAILSDNNLEENKTIKTEERKSARSKKSAWGEGVGPTRSTFSKEQRSRIGLSRVNLQPISSVSPLEDQEEEDEEEDTDDDAYDISYDSDESDFASRETDRLEKLYKDLALTEFDNFDEEFEFEPIRNISQSNLLESLITETNEEKKDEEKLEENVIEIEKDNETLLEEQEIKLEEIEIHEDEKLKEKNEIKSENQEKIENQNILQPTVIINQPYKPKQIDEYEDIEEDTVPVVKYLNLLDQFKELQQQFILQSEELSQVKEAIRNKHSKKKERTFTSGSIKISNKEKKQKLAQKMALQEQEIEEEKEQRKMIMELKEQRRKEQEESRRANLTDKTQLQRMSVLQEILNTEKTYLYSLQLLIRAKYSLHKGKAITEHESNLIFSNIEDIYGIHQQIEKTLDNKFTNDNECWKISTGDIFLKLAEALTTYTSYVDNQAKQNQIVSLCGQRKHFITSLTRGVPEFEAKELVIVQFNSYLITPIQRICKYPLLLRELIKFTDDSHEDKKTLQKALNQLQTATMQINERKKEFESYVKMLEIQENVEHLPRGFQLITPSRMFIREAYLAKISKGKFQERHFFLFTDLILYCSKNVIKSNKYQMKGKIPIDCLLVRNLQDSESLKNAFELVRMDHKKKKYIICTKDPAEKQLWMEDIEQRVLYYLEVARRKQAVDQNVNSDNNNSVSNTTSDNENHSNDNENSNENSSGNDDLNNSTASNNSNEIDSVDGTNSGDIKLTVESSPNEEAYLDEEYERDLLEQKESLQIIVEQIDLLKKQTDSVPENERKKHIETIELLEEEFETISNMLSESL